MDTRFYGSLVALVTPMTQDAQIDYDAIARLINFHLDEGTDGLVMVGTTGESPTISMEEHRKVIAHAVNISNGRIPIIAGTGANSTEEAIQLTRFAESVGADAVLSVVPYYNKPTQEGLYQHFCAVAQTIKIPLILYNVPKRTGGDLETDTVIRLADVPNIIGLKDATADLARGADLLKRCPESFMVLSGEDITALPLMLLGAKGVISVTANIAPRLVHHMCAAALAHQWQKAVEIHMQLVTLNQKLFLESNPIPVKWALARMGLIGDTIRLPLTSLSSSCHQELLQAMKELGITCQA